MITSTQFGLIGLGPIGTIHLSTIEAFQAEGRAQIAAVADPAFERSPERRRPLEDRGVRCYTDYRQMLRDEELDAVTIATPIPFHYEMTKACLERGLYVYLEKPPVPLLQQLDSLIAADPKFLVGVGFQMILSKCLNQLKKTILEKKLGEVLEIAAGGCWPRLTNYYTRANWAGKLVLNGNPVLDGPATNGLAHVIHNMMYLAGEQPREFASPTEIQGVRYRARPIES